MKQIFKEHPKAVFFTRLGFFVLFALILPLLFIGFRFELFSKRAEFTLSGWGIIAVIIIAIFVIGFVRYLKLGIKGKYSLVVQCINGFLKIIVPLITLYVIMYNIKNNLDYFLQALGCLILCEAIAIPINPMPKWAYEAQKDLKVEDKKDTIDYLLSQIKPKDKND